MEIIEHTIRFVKEQLKNAEGGHDWFHIERVYKNVLLIAEGEDCDVTVVKLGALLHDIAKPLTTKVGEDGRVRAKNHEEIGKNYYQK